MGVRIRVRSLWAKPNAATFVYEFAQSRVVIGRGRSADVRLPHTAVSPTHLTIRTKDAGYVLVDEASTNGTRINETPIVPGRPRALCNHDRIDLGGFHLTVEVGVPVARAMSVEQSTRYAIGLLAEEVGEDDEPSLRERLADLDNQADRTVELLPIPEDPEPTPPSLRPSDPAPRPREEHARRALSRSEIAVLALAGGVLALCLVAMLVLIRLD